MNAMDELDELPLLTEVANDSEVSILPVLTEVILPAETMPPAASVPPARALNPEEIHQLLQQLEAHLETVFAGKLNKQLEQLQHLAVDLAINEFKAELPKLLRDALISTTASDKP